MASYCSVVHYASTQIVCRMACLVSGKQQRGYDGAIDCKCNNTSLALSMQVQSVLVELLLLLLPLWSCSLGCCLGCGVLLTVMPACRWFLQVLPPPAWDVLFREVERRLAARPGAVQHLIVLLPVPIVYPKIPVTETMLGAISSESSCRCRAPLCTSAQLGLCTASTGSPNHGQGPRLTVLCVKLAVFSAEHSH